MSVGLAYDTGALVAAESGSRRLWAIHKRALERGVIPVVPAAVIVEAWRGGPSHDLSRLLRGTETEPLTDATARRAGELLAGASGVQATDATVVETALRSHSAVVTCDRDDMERLAAEAQQRLNIIDV